MPGLRRDDVRPLSGKDQIVALGADLTSVKCKGEWLSVGLSVDAQEGNPRMCLTGDHSLGNGDPATTAFLSAPNVGTPFVSLGTNFPAGNTNCVGWLDRMHRQRGNVVMGDGSVDCLSRARLQDTLKKLGGPGRAVGIFTGGSPNSPPGVNRVQLP